MVWSSLAVISFALAAPGAPANSSDWDILRAIQGAGPVVKGVMLILMAFSVLSWAIIISKFRQLRRARRENAEFFEGFWTAPDLRAAHRGSAHLKFSPAARMLRETLAGEATPSAAEAKDRSPEAQPRAASVRRGLRRSLAEESDRLSRSLSFLATCGSTAPFIGLFGTVWGIMTSFQSIGVKGSASLATVAPGIAEALIATAAGLAAAIPAVMAYNYFLGQVRRLESELGDFAADLEHLLTSADLPPSST